MILSKGQRLGPYEIEAPVGSGAMGEVYRAKDIRLDRVVAIKVLPAALALDRELRDRFVREAKLISSLNHPNICTLFDVGHQEGIDFLVLEYVEGETIADRLCRGTPSLKEVINIGIQIADALESAHRRGIVHRDLKPGNIMLTKTGVKLVDFGLARLVREDETTRESDEATRKNPLTGKGAILGTIQYMAPEQLEKPRSRSSGGYLCLRRSLIRNGNGQAGLSGRQSGKSHCEHTEGRAAADERTDALGSAGIGTCSQAVFVEES